MVELPTPGWASRRAAASYDLAMEAGRLRHATPASRLAAFFGAPDPDRVVFAANATDALNLAIQGLVGPGDHVVSTRLEHNSVLRPLFHLKERGWIDYDLVPFDGAGLVDPERHRRSHPAEHQAGGGLPRFAGAGHRAAGGARSRACAPARGVPLLLDAAQTAGQVPIDMTALGRERRRLHRAQGAAAAPRAAAGWCWLRTWRCGPPGSAAPASTPTVCVTPRRSRTGWRRAR